MLAEPPFRHLRKSAPSADKPHSAPMNRLTAKDFSPGLLELYDGYVHGRISRRQFLERAGQLALGGMTAVGVLAALSPNFAAGQQVPADDARLKVERVTLPSPAGYGSMRGYLVRPASAKNGHRALQTIFLFIRHCRAKENLIAAKMYAGFTDFGDF